MSAVANAMVRDFKPRPGGQENPSFFFHLGNVVFSFGESQYYYDQFYQPYRNYPAPIVAIAGNHDGMVAPQSTATTLQAFLTNFCATSFHITRAAGGLTRTAQIEPGVYFTFEAPFVRIIALYSGTLEGPGVISSQHGQYPELGDAQLKFLETALRHLKDFPGAVILAVHHNPYYYSPGGHGGSPLMEAEIDDVARRVGRWPDAVLSAHAHNYERMTRLVDSREIPYIGVGNGGHGILPISTSGIIRVPCFLKSNTDDEIILDDYDDDAYGYLKVVVNERELRIQYVPVSNGSGKVPDDEVVVDIQQHKLVREARARTACAE
jgi:hypothetical protein